MFDITFRVVEQTTECYRPLISSKAGSFGHLVRPSRRGSNHEVAFKQQSSASNFVQAQSSSVIVSHQLALFSRPGERDPLGRENTC